MQYFTKQPSEQYAISVEFYLVLQSGISLVSGTVSAIDISNNNSDATSIVLDSATVTINATKASIFVKAGVDGHTYKISMVITTTGSTPVSIFEEDLFMEVKAL